MNNSGEDPAAADSISSNVRAIVGAVLILEASLGIICKIWLTAAVTRRTKNRAANIYIIDECVGDTVFLTTWILSQILSLTNVFAGDIVLTGQDALDPHNIAHIILDIFNTISFVHSIAILTVISVQRYRTVFRPIAVYTEAPKDALQRVLYVWVGSTVLGGYVEFSFVDLMYRYSEVQYVFQGIFTLLTYVLPLTIIAFCYAKITHQLRERLHNVSLDNSVTDNRQERRDILARKIPLLAFIFAGSWFLYNVVYLVVSVIDPLNTKYPVQTFWATVAGKIIAYINFTLNPIALAYINKDLRWHIASMLPIKMPFLRSRRSLSTMSTQTQMSDIIK